MLHLNRFYLTPLVFLLTITLPSWADSKTDAFGKSESSQAAFIGVMYDLKQTQELQPTDVTPKTYADVLDVFLSQGWNEDVLNRYYRVSKPLYTTQIFIPNMNAEKAPEAFGAQDKIKPRCWVIHYKGQISPPESGSYRFWAVADDVIAVAINGKTVVLGVRDSIAHSFPKTNWNSTDKQGAYEGDTNLRAGDWMDLAQDQIYDIDIIIGERPGGVFNAFLMVEKKGNSYQTDAQGHLILPILQIAPFENVKTEDTVFASGYPTWKCYQ